MAPSIVLITVIVAAGVLFLPGGVAAAILGFRGIGLVGVASSLSLAGIALFSLIGIVVPVPWTGLTWAISAALVVSVAVVIRQWKRRRYGWQRSSVTARWSGLVPFFAIAIAAVAIGIRVFPILADEGISQTFDNIYHLNAVRYVLDTAIIAPTRQIIPGFYPSLWHALTATIAMLSGSSVPMAVNVTSITIAMLVWPTSAVFLTRQIIGPSVVAALTSGVLAAGMAGFPTLMLDYGVLYPNLLSIALLPAALALLLQVAGVGDGDRAPLPIRWTLLLVSVTVLALAHPSTLMAFFAIGFWPAAVAGARWLRQARTGPRAPLVWGLSGWVIGVGSVITLLLVARPTRAQAFWMPSATIFDAVSQVLWNSVAWKPPSPTIMITMMLGIVTILVLRRSWWWLVAAWMTLATLYVACAAFPDGLLRYGLTGTWYSDLFRIAALMPTILVPLGAVGVALALEVILRLLRAQGGLFALGTGVVVSSVLMFTTQTGAQMVTETATAAETNTTTDVSPLLTLSETDLLHRLPNHVPEDELIVGSPWTGTSLSYALADRRALIPHIYQELDPDMELLLSRLNEAGSDSAVCDALARTNTRWVLDFGTVEVHDGAHEYAGLAGLADAEGFQLVDQEGPDARLFRITACGT